MHLKPGWLGWKTRCRIVHDYHHLRASPMAKWRSARQNPGQEHWPSSAQEFDQWPQKPIQNVTMLCVDPVLIRHSSQLHTVIQSPKSHPSFSKYFITAGMPPMRCTSCMKTGSLHQIAHGRSLWNRREHYWIVRIVSTYVYIYILSESYLIPTNKNGIHSILLSKPTKTNTHSETDEKI